MVQKLDKRAKQSGLLILVLILLLWGGGRLPTAIADMTITFFTNTNTLYASRVADFRPGAGANPTYGHPQDALGPPDWSADGEHGFVNLGVEGSITLEFTDNLLINGPAADLQIYGDPANDEQIKVEVSSDGVTYRSFGLVDEWASLDLAAVGLQSARFVRITDDGSQEQHGGDSPGAEIDAVEALPPVGTPFADRVVAFRPGAHANPTYTKASDAVGAPDLSNQFSTGFVNLGIGGSITLEFTDNVITDGPGNDFELYGDPANDEKVQIEISADGTDYRSLGLQGEMAALDLAQVGLKSVRFVRITDDGSQEQTGGDSPGAEVDAIGTLSTERTAPDYCDRIRRELFVPWGVEPGAKPFVDWDCSIFYTVLSALPLAFRQSLQELLSMGPNPEYLGTTSDGVIRIRKLSFALPFATLLFHELGHAVHQRLLSQAQIRIWQELHNRSGDDPDNYAGDPFHGYPRYGMANWQEDFGETFKKYLEDTFALIGQTQGVAARGKPVLLEKVKFMVDLFAQAVGGSGRFTYVYRVFSNDEYWKPMTVRRAQAPIGAEGLPLPQGLTWEEF